MHDRRSFLGRLVVALSGLVGANIAKGNDSKGNTNVESGIFAGNSDTTVDKAIKAFNCQYGKNPWGVLVSHDIFKELSQENPSNHKRFVIEPTRQGALSVIIHKGVVVVFWYWVSFEFSNRYRVANPVSYSDALSILLGPGKNLDPITIHYKPHNNEIEGGPNGHER